MVVRFHAVHYNNMISLTMCTVLLISFSILCTVALLLDILFLFIYFIREKLYQRYFQSHCWVIESCALQSARFMYPLVSRVPVRLYCLRCEHQMAMLGRHNNIYSLCHMVLCFHFIHECFQWHCSLVQPLPLQLCSLYLCIICFCMIAFSWFPYRIIIYAVIPLIFIL